MKKIVLILLSAFVLSGCQTPGVHNPGMKEEEVFVKVGSKVLKVHYVILSSTGGAIYLLTPKDTTVDVIIEQVGFKSGKTQTSVITVE